MANEKLVQVGNETIAFPADMPDAQIELIIRGQQLSSKPERSFLSAVGNAPVAAFGSTVKGLSDVASALMQPKQTISGLANLGEGVIAKAPGGKKLLSSLGESAQDIKKAENVANIVGEDYAQTYGSWPKFKETLATDPFRLVADLSAGAGVAGRAAQAAKASRLGETLSTIGEATNPMQLATKPLEIAGKVIPTKQRVNPTKAETIKQSQSAGYTIPRSEYEPSAATNILESIGGKSSIGQEAAKRNQEVTNSLAKKYIGLPENEAFSTQSINELVKNNSAIYEQARKLPAGVVGESTTKAIMGNVKSKLTKTGDQLVDEIRKARKEARDNYNHYERSADPAAQERAEAAVEKANKLESELDTLAKQNWQPDLLNELRASRVNLAKIHTVENAMNPATGEINAKIIKSQYNKGAPISEEGKVIADFANAFENLAREGSKVPSPDVSQSKALAAYLMTAGGGGAGALIGGPVGMGIGAGGGALLGSLPFTVPPVAKSLALSKMLQKTPNEASMIKRLMQSSGNANPLALALYESRNVQGEQ